MASVHYLVEDVNSFRNSLYNKTCLLQKIRGKRVMAAINIQRHWRGYCVRKHQKRLAEAALTIQTAYRGWIVRWKMNQYISDFINARNNRLFNQMATKISVAWRGYWVRKNLPDNQNMVKRRILREQMNVENQKTVALMSEALNRLKRGPKSIEQVAEEEEQCKQWVLYILHKCHHLIRTTQIPGIYSDKNSHDLTFVEQLIKSVSMKEYMDHIKNEYYEMQKQPPPKTPYIYERRAIRRMEDAFKLRYKFNDDKSMSSLNINENINEKPFILSTRVPEKPYEKLLIYQQECYRKPQPFCRVSKPELNISKHDFVLSNKCGKLDPDLPPYYIDDWQKKKCSLHYPVYINGD